MKTIELKVVQNINDDGTLYSISYLNDKDQLHNENGPAIFHYHNNGKISSEQYWINGKGHNENGPSYIRYYESGKIESELYYIKNHIYSKKDFDKKINLKKNTCDGKIVEIDGKKYSLTEVK